MRWLRSCWPRDGTTSCGALLGGAGRPGGSAGQDAVAHTDGQAKTMASSQGGGPPACVEDGTPEQAAVVNQAVDTARRMVDVGLNVLSAGADQNSETALTPGVQDHRGRTAGRRPGACSTAPGRAWPVWCPSRSRTAVTCCGRRTSAATCGAAPRSSPRTSTSPRSSSASAPTSRPASSCTRPPTSGPGTVDLAYESEKEKWNALGTAACLANADSYAWLCEHAYAGNTGGAASGGDRAHGGPGPRLLRRDLGGVCCR